MNPFLILLSLLAGAVISWLLVVRRVTVEVPVVRPLADTTAAGVRPAYEDEPTEYVGEPTAYAHASTGAAAPADLRPATHWADGLRHAESGLAGSGAVATGAVAVGAVASGAVAVGAEANEVAASPAPEAEAVASPGRLPDSVPAPPDGAVPAGYTVKGDTNAGLYLLASDRDFGRARPDIWFVDELAALDAGYTLFDRTPAASADD